MSSTYDVWYFQKMGVVTATRIVDIDFSFFKCLYLLWKNKQSKRTSLKPGRKVHIL